MELGNWAAFEAASLTLTSVALILPLGTLTARRLSQSHGLGYDNFSSTTRVALPFNLNNSQLSPGTKSFATSSNATATPQSTVLSHCEAGAYRNDPDTMDLELCQLDGDRIYNGQVRVYHSFEQNEQRI